jgi:hypothetical protein
MDAKPLRLEAFSKEQIVRPAVLQTLSQDTIPSLQQLREIERDIQEYKKQHEQRFKQCEAQLIVVNDQYSIMKDRDPNKAKQLKKGL